MSSAVAVERRTASPRQRGSARPASYKGYARRRFWLAIAVVLYVTAMGFGRVYTQTLLSQTVIDTNVLETRHRALAAENEKLRVEDVVLRSPARLERFAIGRLGMVRPDQVHYITVEPPALSKSSDKGQGRLLASMRGMSGP